MCACGQTDGRKGFDRHAGLAQQHLGQDPFGVKLIAFRGRRGDLMNILSGDKQDLYRYA